MRPHSLALPDDPSIELLSEPVREAVTSHWLHRAASERSVAVAFEQLSARLRGVRAVDTVVSLAEKAIDDERRHGDLCVRLARRYRGADVPDPEPRAGDLPDFSSGDEPL